MNADLYSEEEILKACKKNKRQFQEILYRKYAKKMFGICMSYAGDRSTAQDILQDSFIKIFRKIKDFNMIGSLEGWVRRIVVNTAIDHIRKEQRVHNFIYDEIEINDNSQVAAGYENLKTHDILEQVSKLPDGARMVFNLYAIDGFSHKEIAQKLNITVGTSKSQFSRARKLLMLWLNKLSA